MQRILDDGYGNYIATSAWLQEQGFAISKSALHRFGKELKDMRGEALLVQHRRLIDQPDMLLDLRMRCLESAAATAPDDVLHTAALYLEWVLSNG